MKYLLVFFLLLLTFPAYAKNDPDGSEIQDIVDVTGGLPITIDDSGVQDKGTWAAQFSTSYQHAQDHHTISANPQLQYGVIDDLEFSFGIPYNLESVEGSHDDNLTAALKYNFVHEKNNMPALAIQQEASLPTANNVAGVDTTTTIMATKHILPRYGITGIFLNAGWTKYGKIESDNRRNAFSVAAGFSHAITDRTALVADLVEQNEEDKGRSDTVAELGFRHGVNKHLILSFGGGVGLNNDAPDFTAVMGAEYGF